MPLTIVGTSFNAAYEGVELDKLQVRLWEILGPRDRIVATCVAVSSVAASLLTEGLVHSLIPAIVRLPEIEQGPA